VRRDGFCDRSVEEENMKKLLWIGAVVSVALVTYSIVPDIRRYIRMVSM
jgi:hypothetical protein